MKVLVTGAEGQVGRALQATKPDDCNVVPATRALLDITDAAAVHRMLDAERPDWVINCAAYTAVDRAESDVAAARLLNSDACGTLAQMATACGTRVLHISTDFVFDGEQSHPYRVDDKAAPVNVYGATKLAGENAVHAATGGSAIIVRTSWVYSSRPPNFVLRMLELLATRPVLKVVSDQVGTPTWAHSLALCLWALATGRGRSGTFHWSDSGVASWYDLAIAIQELAFDLGLLTTRVPITPIRSDEYPVAARRPHYSVLDTRSTSEAIGWVPEHWRVSLARMLGQLGSCRQ